MRLASALPGGTRVLEHFGGDRELLIGVEAEDLLGRPHLVLAEGRAMGGSGVLGVRGRPRDDRREADEGRARIGLRGLDGRVEGVDVLGVLTAGGEVDVLDVPAVGLVAGRGVLAEGDGRVVLDGDAVVVPDDEQVRELLGAGQRRRLTGDALLHVPVGGEDDDLVVERRGAGSRIGVEESAFATGGHGHAHRRGDTGAERSRGDLDTRGVPDLGMAGSERTPCARRALRSSSSRPNPAR